MDAFPSPDDTISACVPRAALTVFDAIVLGDWDTPMPRCGAGLRFLKDAGFVRDAPNLGDTPLAVTETGRELARERQPLYTGAEAGHGRGGWQSTTGVGGVVEW